VGRLHGRVAGIAAQAAGTQLRVGGRRDREDLRLAQQVQRVVQDVDPDVGQRAAAGQGRVREPAAEHGDALPPEPGCLGVVRPAQFAVVDDAFQLLDVPAASVVEGHVQDPAGLPRSLHHLAALFTVAGQGLFTQDVQPAFQGGDRDRCVQERRNRNADGVEPVQLDQVLPARKCVGDAVLVLDGRKQVLLHRGDRDEFDAGDVLVGLDVLLAGPADADDADPEGGGLLHLVIAHEFFPFFFSG